MTTAFVRAGLIVVSVEHDQAYINRCGSHFIHAPIVDGWYDREILRDRLRGIEYDMLLIDGPPGHIGRQAVLENLDTIYFNDQNPSVVMIDDINRPAERRIFEALAKSYPHSEIVRDFEPHEHFAGILYRSEPCPAATNPGTR
ncbi:MAG: hypothetical protein KDD44_06250 [Bdellovibrionales bacterium]|nr:hypothetical protein [Bdellovibrionales bacterium]